MYWYQTRLWHILVMPSYTSKSPDHANTQANLAHLCLKGRSKSGELFSSMNLMNKCRGGLQGHPQKGGQFAWNYFKVRILNVSKTGHMSTATLQLPALEKKTYFCFPMENYKHVCESKFRSSHFFHATYEGDGGGIEHFIFFSLRAASYNLTIKGGLFCSSCSFHNLSYAFYNS